VIKREDVHKAIDAGILDAISDRAKTGTVTIESEPGKAEQDQFEVGLRMLKEAHDRQHSVVDDVFPE
jgi:hypothetical protein